MEITVVVDNRTQNSDLLTEHGLSIYLDTGSEKWMLDLGATDLLLKNAITLGINLSEVDKVFLSHGHNDHTGGLVPFCEENSKAIIYMAKEACEGHFFSFKDGEMRDLSNYSDSQQYKDRIKFDFAELNSSDVAILNVENAANPQPKANRRLFEKVRMEFEKDMFDHERVFAKEMDKGWFVFSGCTHKGILNVMERMTDFSDKPVNYLFGGFHLPDGDNESAEELVVLADKLKLKYPQTTFFTGHCTGVKAFTLMKKVLGDQLQNFYTGLKLTL